MAGKAALKEKAVEPDLKACVFTGRYDSRCMSYLWQAAAAFSARSHKNQLRKDGVTPYASHPVRVALTTAMVFGAQDEELLAAALLHDTIEDTATDYDELKELFGTRVADLVACVSKDMRMEEDAREQAYDDQLAAGPWEARLIKLADVFDNMSDALDDAARLKDTMKKAERAIALAKDDPQLKMASEQVRRLMKELKGGGKKNRARGTLKKREMVGKKK
ncbi:MAG TPA: HD domain-containing protein [Phycisphaerales bacterium]|nr:HD domain-containing protein [Phycisphaerales bacterium]